MTITLVAETGFEAGDWIPGAQEHVDYGVRILEEGDALDGIAAAPAPFNGTRLARFLRKVGDPGNVIGAPYRSEFHYSNRLDEKRRRAYRFMTWHGSAESPLYWKIGDSEGWRTWFQLHPNSGSPMLCLESSSGDRFKIKRRVGTSSTPTDVLDVTDLMRFDDWNEWIVDVLHTTDNDGFIHIWLNGEQIVDLNNIRTVPRDVIAVYPKQGLYHTYSSSTAGLAFGDMFAIADSDNLTDDLFAFLHQVPSGDGSGGPTYGDPQTVTLAIMHDDDDVQVRKDGSAFGSGGSYVTVRSDATDASAGNMGLRFREGVSWSDEAEIQSAKLVIPITHTARDDVQADIRLVDEANAAAWSESRRPYSGDLTLYGGVEWSGSSFGIGDKDSPDIAPLIQRHQALGGGSGRVPAFVIEGRTTASLIDLDCANYGAGGAVARLVVTYAEPVQATNVVLDPFPFELTWTEGQGSVTVTTPVAQPESVAPIVPTLPLIPSIGSRA